MVTSAYERVRYKRNNESRQGKFPAVSVSKRNARLFEAIAFWKASRANVSDKLCQAGITAFEKELKESANNNMLYYTDEYQRRLQMLPKITEYRYHVDTGGKGLVDMYVDGQIKITDLFEAYSSASALLAEISKNKKVHVQILNLIAEEIKHGSKE